MAEDSTLGLLFEIAADPSKAISATTAFRDQASAALREFEEHAVESFTHVTGISKEMGLGFGVAIGAAVGLGAAMYELAEKAAVTGAKMYEVHEITGLSTETLSGINAITKITGENFDGLSRALGRAGVNLEKLIEHGKNAKGALVDAMGGAQGMTELGLKPMDAQLETVLKHIFELSNEHERNAALSQLLGRAWQQDFETLKILAEQGFGPAIEKAKELGISFSEQDAAGAKAFEMEMANLKAELESFAASAGKNLIPVMSTLVQWFRSGNITVGGLSDAYLKHLMDVNKLAETQKILKDSVEAETKSWYENVQALLKDKAEIDAVTQLRVKLFASDEKAENKAAKEKAEFDARVRGLVLEMQLKAARVEAEGVIRRLTEANKEMMEGLVALPQFLDPSIKQFTAYDLVIQKTAKDLLQMPLALHQVGEAMNANAQIAQKNLENATRYDDVMVGSIQHHGFEYKKLGALTEQVFDGMTKALTKHHTAEMALKIARAGMRAIEEVAEALSALGNFNYWSAAQHFASAAEFGVMAAFSGGGGGGYGGGGGGGTNRTPIANVLPPAMANTGGAVGSVPGGTVHVIVSSDNQALANHLGSVITNGVRFGDTQVVATAIKG